MKTRREWIAPSGNQYPLIEADHDYDVTCYRSDKRKAIPHDGEHCVVALGVKRNKRVLECWIGSGLDAYVAFSGRKPYAKHFTVGTSARRVIDKFDTDQGAATIRVTLKAPAPSHKLSSRRVSNKKRREEVANGAQVKHRDTPKRKVRVQRYDVGHRDHATIVRVPV